MTKSQCGTDFQSPETGRSLVHLLDSDIDHALLWQEVQNLLTEHNLWDQQQVSVTSVDGRDDWGCSVGRLIDLPHPERFYAKINQSLQDTYLAECLSRYSQYYRWRLMRLTPKSTYTIHSDNLTPGTRNLRIHIPVISNPGCLMYFYPQLPQDGHTLPVTFHHLEPGHSYEADTTGLHCAMNHGTTDRYHIVGVRYQNQKSDK